MVQIGNIKVNGLDAETSVPVVAPQPYITWTFEGDAGAPAQATYSIRIGSETDNWGNSLFNGTALSINVDGSENSYKYEGFQLSRGTTYYGQISATDIDEDAIVWTTFSFTINRLPFITGYSLSPDNPSSADHIDLIYTFQDADGHNQAGTLIRWFRNNLPMTAYDNLCTLPSSATNPSDYWNAKIIPSDGIEFGTMVETSTVTVGAVDSNITSAQILPPDANVDDILKVVYTVQDDEYFTFTGSVQVEWYINDTLYTTGDEHIRPQLSVGDSVYAIVKLLDGTSVISQRTSDALVIEDSVWHIDDLTISGLVDTENLTNLDPIIAWTAHKSTADASDVPTYFRLLITKTPSLDGPLYDTGITEYVKDSHAISDGILSRGQRYYVHIGASDISPIPDSSFVTKEIRMAGSSWAETVDNATGWTIEFKAGLALDKADGTPMSQQDIDTLDYTPNFGVYIHDGSRFCAITVGLREVTFLSDSAVTYTFGQRLSSTQITSASSGKTFRIAAQGNDIRIFMNNELIIEGSGTLTNPSLLKMIEYGDIDGKNENICLFKSFRYTTSGAYRLDDSLTDTDTYYFSRIGKLEGGSIEFVFGDFLSWTPTDATESSKLIKFDENNEVTRLATVSRNFSPITAIYIDESRNKFIGTANGVTQITGEKHDPDYEFLTDSLEIEISPEDFDRMSTVTSDKIAAVEPNYRQGWFTIDTTYRSLGAIETQSGFFSGDPYDPYKFALSSHAIHYYSQRTHGHSWYDNVDNEKGWQVSFGFDLESLEADDYEDQNLDKTGFGVYINDGTRQEVLYFYEDRIRLFYANVYVPISTANARDYVISGKGNNLLIYQKLQSNKSSSYSLIVNASGLFTTSASISGNSRKPAVAVDSSGMYHAVWHDDGNGRSQILHSSFDGQSWSNPETITESLQFSMKNPAITIDSLDRIWIAYEDTSWGQSEISVSVKDSGGWNPKTRITNARSNKGRPDIQVDTEDNVHLVWEDDRDGHYKIFWAQWNNARKAWESSGQAGDDDAIMQFNSTDEYQVDEAVEFKNPKLGLIYPYIYLVCEGHYQESQTSAIYRGFRDLVDKFWNTSGSIITDDGDFSGIGQPQRVSDPTRNAWNPSIATTPTSKQYVIAWEDRTEPVTHIYGVSYYYNGLPRAEVQPLTSYGTDCTNPSVGFVATQGVVAFERDNNIYTCSYNPLSNEFDSSYSGGTDTIIDTGTRSVSNPALPKLSSSSAFVMLYDYSLTRNDGTLASKEFPEYQLIGDATIDHTVIQTDVGAPGPTVYEYTYVTTTIGTDAVSKVDTKEFAFGDFAENVGMVAHWQDIKMYFGYDARPQSIVMYNGDTVQNWPDPRINDLFVDTFGNVVAATFGGLVYYNKGTGQLLQIEGHTSEYTGTCSSSSCLLMDVDADSGETRGILTTTVKWGGNGIWYVGTTNGVIVSQNAGKEWSTLDAVALGDSTIGSKIVNDIAVDKDGKAYIAAHEESATSGYIYISMPNTTTIEIAMDEVIKTIEVDENYIVWAGSDKGLWRVENARNKIKFDRSSGMKSAHVNDITIVNKHLRYLSTANGVERMNGLTFSNLNVDTHNLVNNNVNTVLWDASTNSLWVGALYTLHEIVFRDEAHEIIDNETVHYDNSEISTKELYDKNIYYIIDPDVIEAENLTSESAAVFINRNPIDFGYVVSESSIFFLTDLLVSDQVEVEVSERFVEFHNFNQKSIEEEVLGSKRSIITKVNKTSQDQFIFLSGGDKNSVLLYSGETSLPFTTITLDTRPPEGCIEQLETLSRTKIRFRIFATDDLSGVNGFMLSNYPNFTSDGETPLDFQPAQSIYEHDIGEGINNVFDSLSIPSTVTIGPTTYDVGTGAALAPWFDERNSVTYLFMATSAPAVVFRYDPTTDEWTGIQVLETSDADRIVTGMKTLDNIVYLTTGSPATGAEGNIWRCSDGIAEQPFTKLGGTPSAQYARGITSGSDQTVYFGSSNGTIYQYNNNNLSILYHNIGDEVNDLDVFVNTMIVGTGHEGRIYSINLETNDNLIIFDSSDTDINNIHIKDSKIVASPDKALLYAGSSNSTTIYRTNLDSLDFVKSYSSFGKDINLIGSPESIVFESDQSQPVAGSSTIAAIGDSLFRHVVPAWEFFYKHDEDINDFTQYQTNGVEGIWIVSNTKVTKWTAAFTEKTVYLRLRDNAGNISAPPVLFDEQGQAIICPDLDANPPVTCCSAYSIKIEDLADFVNEGRIVDVDSTGNIDYAYESPNNRVFYSADQIDQEVGIYTSEILNGSNDLVSWKSIEWDSDEPTGTSINVQIRTGVTEDNVEDADWSANVVLGSDGTASLEHITDQYLQFRTILTSQVRDLSPTLTSVTIRSITSQASHFFTTNFVLPSRPIKGVLTANTYIPVSSDIVFGVNTKDSVDFGDYQIIEDNRLFTTTQGQFGSDLRIGAKLLSPGLPQLQPTNNPGDPYDASSFICTIEFDYENIGPTDKNYDFRVRFYNDLFRTQLGHTFFSGNDQSGWSYSGGADDVFPSDGLLITSGSTRSIEFVPMGISQNQKWYITVEAISTDVGAYYESILDNTSFICAACNVDYIAGLTARYFCGLPGPLEEMPIFSSFTPSHIGTEPVINFPAHNGGWRSGDPSLGTMNDCWDNFAARFQGSIYCPVTGEYTFAIESDDGSKLFIDNEILIDNDHLQPMTKLYGDPIQLNMGWHTIEIHYFDSSFDQGLILYWTPPGETETIVPSDNLAHPVVDEYCDLNVPQIFNFIVQFELENGETVQLNLTPPS